MKRLMRVLCATVFVLVSVSAARPKKTLSPAQQRATKAIHEYFRRVVRRIAERTLADVKTKADWERQRLKRRRELLDMLGLNPLPAKTDLKATVTGKVEGDTFVVEKLHYQSLPGLYVTANFYKPKGLTGRAPTILYVCGHGRVKINGVSYGNKAHYQHHAAWFARHGYCCLIIDSLQLGEIEGIHHGTYRYGMWWWVARGYTPAGVEAWNCVRALDYLATRPEVDMQRIGVTGRSGGGIYTWWIAAIDDRPKVLVPVAGITDLKNYVVDGAIEGHCDCMFMVNTYQWDFPLVAALAAPRPLLLSNSDKDRIFPLDGVLRVYWHLRRLYELYNASDHLGLLITEGPHRDTQELRLPAFRWMNRWLKNTQEPICEKGEQPFKPQQLKVFDRLPADERNTCIHETFVPRARFGDPPRSMEQWQQMRERLMAGLRERVFRPWPRRAGSPEVKVVAEGEKAGLAWRAISYHSEENLWFPVYMFRPAELEAADELRIVVVSNNSWSRWSGIIAVASPELLEGVTNVEPQPQKLKALAAELTHARRVLAVVPPRGIGPNQWDPTERADTHIRRRFVLLGMTAATGAVWDIRRAVHALQGDEFAKAQRVVLTGRGRAAGLALYAALFEPSVCAVELDSPPETHRNPPIFLNVLRVLDMPQAVALMFPRHVVLRNTRAELWQWPAGVANLYARNPFEISK